MIRNRPRVLVAVTASGSCVLLRGQLGWAKEHGFDVALLSSPGPAAEALAVREGATLLPVPMERGLAPLRDLVALVRICGAVIRFRPQLVNAGTPKAGLLVTVAAWLCRVPCRIYHLRGLHWEMCSGTRRAAYYCLERLACLLATRVLCDSHSLRSRALALGLLRPEQGVVLRSGSSNGVDLRRFAATPAAHAEGRRRRAAAGIPADAVVVGFVGRVTRDKGLVELAEAWRMLRAQCAHAHLLIVGAPEEPELPPAHRRALASDRRVHLVGGVDTPEDYYAMMDLVVLPTYREGFGNVLIEAAAMELPVVATRVTGCVDAVVHGATGTLVPARDAHALAEGIRRYVSDRDLRVRHGRAGRERVAREFPQESVWAALHAEYVSLLGRKGLPLPAVPERVEPGTGARAQEAHADRTSGAAASLTSKRTLDVAVAVCGLLLLAPLMAAVAVLVRGGIGRPVLFRQRRAGLGGRAFTMLKFRTMTDARNAQGELLPDADRLTRLGRFLRATSLDELPELWNVLQGDMSLVGPRPLLLDYLPHYSPTQARRHDVRPGVTGWAQVNGRNALEWHARFELDVWYVDHQSLRLDMKILWLTLRRVLSRRGITPSGRETMEKFTGSVSQA